MESHISFPVLQNDDPSSLDANGTRVIGVNGDICKRLELLAVDQNTHVLRATWEVLLLAWFITLRRTQADDQLIFDWAIGNDGDSSWTMDSLQQFTTNNVKIDLDRTLSQAHAVIQKHVSAPAVPHTLALRDRILILYSASTQKSEDAAHVVKLELRLRDSTLEVWPVSQSTNHLRRDESRLIQTFTEIARTCISTPDLLVRDLMDPTESDLDYIWNSNYQLPPKHRFCMHELISTQARDTPDKVAIVSWDGDLTYNQVDNYSSLIAHRLREGDTVVAHDVIGICFEKSRWTIVATLGAMKAGATYVLMDPSLPVARLQNMAQQAGTTIMLASRQQATFAATIRPDARVRVVEEDAFNDESSLDGLLPLPKVSPTGLMYIIFTSGSTGTPKGVKISHETYTSSAIPRAEAVGYTVTSRVLDFASYAFDVSIDSMLLTLANGGCLCIPSDEDRVNDINGAMRRMSVTYAGLTPSVARILDAEVISSLDALGLGGEAVSAGDVNCWGQQTRIVIGYGPCECTIGCTINSSAATGRNYVSIGSGNGAAIWLADPDHHNRLVPVGAVGELLVEGPIVGEGYLNDPEKTATAFIKDPQWLVSGHKQHAGRTGRLYKTGDLARYDPESPGEFVFVGRKDTQVKLRGQRVELGEIESRLRARLPSNTIAIAEVIKPSRAGAHPVLVAFLGPQSSTGLNLNDLALTEAEGDLRQVISDAETELSKVLPRYMLPSAYLPIKKIPVLISGKTDRKLLRSFGASVDLQELALGSTNDNAQHLTDPEVMLRDAWARCLGLRAEDIAANSNFVAMGGDSLAAMRLVSACRMDRFQLTVADVFANPTLSTMASTLRQCETVQKSEVAAFSLLSEDVDAARLEASQICGTGLENVIDIYPCTATQESLFTFSLRSESPYVAQRIAHIPSDITTGTWQRAWEAVAEALPIQRTRVVQLQGSRLYQVVVREQIAWRHSNDLERYLKRDRSDSMLFGQALARYAIITDLRSDRRFMVWTIHHVVYDGWSEPLILQMLDDALKGKLSPPSTHMKDFVRFLQHGDSNDSRAFWEAELQGAVGPQYPPLPSRDYLPKPDTTVERRISFDSNSTSNFTLATVIRAALALVSSEHTDSDDIVFGETFTGRDIPLYGVEAIVGPLNATVPVRIWINRTDTVEAYLRKVQQAILNRTGHQHIGWQQIRKVSGDAQRACEAGTGLIIQPKASQAFEQLGFQFIDVVREALHFNPFPLMLACGIEEDGFRVGASFDSNIIGLTQVQRVLGQLESACRELIRDPTRRLEDVACIGLEELAQIWLWNQAAPMRFDASTEMLRSDLGLQSGSRYPRAMVPWVCSRYTSSVLKPIGCVGELWLESTMPQINGVPAPTWLTAEPSGHLRRDGRLSPTGDLVRWTEDGDLVFVRPKEEDTVLGSHSFALSKLEALATKHTSSSVQAVALPLQQQSERSGAEQQHQVVLVVNDQLGSAAGDRVMTSDYDITYSGPDGDHQRVRVLSRVSRQLAISLKDFHAAAEDTLPPYVVPSAYVTVDHIPAMSSPDGRALLRQVVSSIPPNVLAQLRHGLAVVWTERASQAQMSDHEEVLRYAWATVLQVRPERIGLSDNFFRLGGDSVLAMKLSTMLRKQGHTLTVAQIFRHMRLKDAAAALLLNDSILSEIKEYRAYSLLQVANVDDFVSTEIRPRLEDPRWIIQDALPVTTPQELDIRATTHAPRTSLHYVLMHFETGADTERLARACSDLLHAHDILRTVFVDIGTQMLQVVVDRLHDSITVERTDQDVQTYATERCLNDANDEHPLGAPFVSFVLVEGVCGKSALVLRLSHAQYDGFTLPTLLRQLQELYECAQVEAYEPFASYVGQSNIESNKSQASSYWQQLLKGSSLSVLRDLQGTVQQASLFRTKAVDIAQLPREITNATLLTAAWALVLARSLRMVDVTFGSVTAGRQVENTSMDRVVGPCYQIAPVRVSFKPKLRAMDILRHVQQQGANSAAHDFLGFGEIARTCTQWPADTRFFDSMVHYQDWEELDNLSFAGGSCSMELLTPHGDAAYPTKAVAFLKAGQMHVGIVGGMNCSAAVDRKLVELAEAMEELAQASLDPITL